MKKLLIFLGALAAYGTDCTISDTVRTPFGGYFAGRIVVALNSPGSAQPLYSGSQTLTGWQTTIEVPASANGAVAVTLVCTDTITPSGTSYSARYQPTSGSPWSETWTPTTGTTTIRAMRSSTVPTPTTTFQASQIVPGSNGQVLTTTAGAAAWGSVPACATCVVTSGSYADPAWLTSLAGSKVSGNISGNAATATALQTARTIAGVSFNGTANISIASTGLSDTANIVRNNAANTYTAGSKQTFAHSATTAGLNVGVQASAPSSPAQGDVFFNSTLTRKGVYDGTQWRYELYAPSSGTGVVSWDGTSLSASTTLAGLASVTSTSFTGALTGNASTATALSSTVASGRLWIGQGTGVPTSDAGLTYGTTPNVTALALTAGSSQSTVYELTGKWNGGNNKFTLGGNNNGYGTMSLFSSAGTQSLYLLNAGEWRLYTLENHPLAFGQNNTERARFAATTGNLLIGTTTDLGYGLHAANKGTNGNFLCFDPTATTGTTKCVFRAGAGQSGNILEVQNSGGSTLSFIGNNGSFASLSFNGYYTTAGGSRFMSIYGDSGPTGFFDLSSDTRFRWYSATALGGSVDTSLSRSSANTLQVGDGGANANGTLLAGRYEVKLGGRYIIRRGSDDVDVFNIYATSSANNDVNLQISQSTGNILFKSNATTNLASLSNAGVLILFNETATTGNTKEVIRAGAGQSTNLQEWQNNAGTVLASIDSIGRYTVVGSGTSMTLVGNNGYGSPTITTAGGNLAMPLFGFSWAGALDLSLSRAAAGVLQVGDGGANANGSMVAASFLGSTTAGGTVVIKNTSGNANYAGITAGRGVSADNGGIDFYSPGASTATLRARIAGTTGNVIIGSDVDSNFKLDIASSGSSGTFRVYDQTATTGSTKVVVRAGAGQSGNLQEWQNNAGTVLAFINDSGTFANGGQTGAILNQTQVVQLGSDRLLAWGSTASYGSTKDLGLARNAAGVLEINNGTAGAYRDLVARIHTWASGTEATCSSTTRGQVVMVQGGAGVADTLRVCRKDAADAYAWTALY